MFPGFGGLDPSKLTPEVVSEITEALRMLSPEQMMRFQTLMHNQLAGFDVAKDMAALEQSLPSGFREKMARILYLANGIPVPRKEEPGAAETIQNVDEARLALLRSVASGILSPEEAFRVLFPPAGEDH